MKTKHICVVTLIVECEKVVPELTDLIAGRAYTIDGVSGVTVERRPLIVPYADIPKPGLSQPFGEFGPMHTSTEDIRKALNGK